MVKVLKFGGTSVGSAKNMRNVAKIIKDEKSTVTVLSAMSGTTDALIKIASMATERSNLDNIEYIISELKDKYKTCACELLSSRKIDADKKIDEVFGIIMKEVNDFKPGISDKIIVAQGELLTTAIFTYFLQESGYNAVLLNAPDFVQIDAEGKVDKFFLEQELCDLAIAKNTFYITQGFICSNASGQLDNLGRGGSDYSAALFGGALHANQVQVWTDIDGMHNNDPRFVENTYAIPKMSFDEAAELAYFGAKILHPATIQPCKDKNIPVFLKSTINPKAKGTMISAEEDTSLIFHAVAAKDGITVIRIYSARMLMAYGFLRKVFEIFENHRTPIDMITTSEVAVSLTIDNDSQLEEIVNELRELGNIEIEQNNTIVCLVGHLEHSEHGLAATIMAGINGVPLKMISYGASHRSIAMLVDTKYKKEILQNLNNSLFPDKNNAQSKN